MPEYLKKSSKAKNYINIYIVSSVKGGCGKSSIAFDLAYKKPDSAIVDLDVLGSTWALIAKQATPKYLTNITSTSDIDETFFWREEINENTVEMIMNETKQSSKQYYYNHLKNGNVPEIEHGIFKNNVIRIIEYLINKGIKNVILDMPPSLDMYSGPIFDFLCKNNTELNIGSKKLRLNFILASPITVVGVRSIYDWICEYFKDSKNMSHITDINQINVDVYFVDLSDSLNDPSSTLKTDLSNAIKSQIDKLDMAGFNMHEEVKNHIVQYSKCWNRIANEEISINSFEGFSIDDI